MKLTRLLSFPPRVAWLALPLCLAACRDADVATYRIPKENDTPAPRAAAQAASADMTMAGGGTGGLAVASSESGGLAWTAPVAWKAKPGSAMRKGSYLVGAEGGPNADLAITAFPGDVGGDLANVNRWLGQLSRPPLDPQDLAATLRPLEGAAVPMQIVDLAGGTADAPARMLGAIVPHEGTTWFFKLTGPDALVAGEKATFLEFLKTVRIAVATSPANPVPSPDSPHGEPASAPAAPAPMAVAAPSAAATPGMVAAAEQAMSSSPVATASGPGLKWKVPSHWQQKPDSPMRKATFAVPGRAGAGDAELAVTAFPGNVGGDLANYNRWRGQLMLPPVSQDEFADGARHFTVNGLAVTVVEITGGGEGSPTRMLGAMVPHAGATWFFKLTGPNTLIVAEKPAFLDFIKSLAP